MTDYPTFEAAPGAAQVPTATLREWFDAGTDTVQIVFPVYPLSESTDIDVLNDTLDEITYPACMLDVSYEIDTERTVEAWADIKTQIDGADRDVVYVRATGTIDWDTDIEDYFDTNTDA